MTLLAKYITTEVVKHFVLILTAVIGIYLAVDFIEKVDNFIEVGAPIGHAVLLLAYKIPFIICQIMPIAVLLAVAITIGLMSKHNELIALRSSGISTIALLGPVARFGFGIALALAIVAEGVAPLTTVRANRIWLQEVKGQRAAATRHRDLWLKTERAILHLTHYHPDTQTAQGVSYHQFDGTFRLVRRLDADTAQFKGKTWHLHNVIEQVLNAETGSYAPHLHPDLADPLNALPEDLKAVMFKLAHQSEEMSYSELHAYIRKMQADGYDATPFKVDLQGKLAYPAACVIMCILGLAVSARGRLRVGLAMSLSYGIGIVFIYWIFYSFCVSLGYGGVLPPVIAAWLANFVFLCAGGVVLLQSV